MAGPSTDRYHRSSASRRHGSRTFIPLEHQIQLGKRRSGTAVRIVICTLNDRSDIALSIEPHAAHLVKRYIGQNIASSARLQALPGAASRLSSCICSTAFQWVTNPKKRDRH